jgi:ribosomal-protein-alanine N-acetyltransferase
MYIREMLDKDVPMIAELEKISYSMPWSETSFYSEVYNRCSITRVAEDDGRLVGYICVKQVADECHLLNMTVHPDYRQRGIATTLYTDVLKDVKEGGCRFMFLEVRESNSSAIKLYEKFNFRTIGIRRNYYIRPEENAVIMMLELGPSMPA